MSRPMSRGFTPASPSAWLPACSDASSSERSALQFRRSITPATRSSSPVGRPQLLQDRLQPTLDLEGGRDDGGEHARHREQGDIAVRRRRVSVQGGLQVVRAARNAQHPSVCRFLTCHQPDEADSLPEPATCQDRRMVIDFARSERSTLGLEWELALRGPADRRSVGAAPELLAAVARDRAPGAHVTERAADQHGRGRLRREPHRRAAGVADLDAGRSRPSPGGGARGARADLLRHAPVRQWSEQQVTERSGTRR